MLYFRAKVASERVISGFSFFLTLFDGTFDGFDGAIDVFDGYLTDLTLL